MNPHPETPRATGHKAIEWAIFKEPRTEWYRNKRSRDGDRHLCAITGVLRRVAVALHKVGTGADPFDAARLFAGPAAAEAARKRNQPRTGAPTVAATGKINQAANAAGGV